MAPSSGRSMQLVTPAQHHHHHHPLSPTHTRNTPPLFKMAGYVLPAASATRGAPARNPVLTTRSWIYRENRVPHYQREFQKHDGLRLWEKVGSPYNNSVA